MPTSCLCGKPGCAFMPPAAQYAIRDPSSVAWKAFMPPPLFQPPKQKPPPAKDPDPAAKALYKLNREWKRYNAKIGPPTKEELLAAAPPSKDCLSFLPPELLLQISSHLDDIAFTCLHSTNTRLHTTLFITPPTITPPHRFLICGMMGLSGVPHPRTMLCEICVVHSEWWPEFTSIYWWMGFGSVRRWRGGNVVLEGVRPTAVERGGHWCVVGELAADLRGVGLVV